MSGGVAPGLEPEEPKDERTPDVTGVVAGPGQRFAQDDPRFTLELEEPEPASPKPKTEEITATDVVMSGFAVGVPGFIKNPENTPREREPLPAGGIQEAVNRIAGEDNLFTGNTTKAQIEAYNLESSGAGGSISGKGTERDGLTPEEQRRKRDEEAALVQSLEQWKANMERDLAALMAGVDAMEQRFAQADVEVIGAFETMAEELRQIAGKHNEQMAAIEVLKAQIEQEKDAAKRAELQERLKAAEEEAKKTLELLQANGALYGELSQRRDEARAEIEQARLRMQELQAAMAAASTQGEREKIQAQMDQERERLQLAQDKIGELQQTAAIMQQAAIASREGTGLGGQQVAALIEATGGDHKLGLLLGNLGAAMVGAGMVVQSVRGETLVTGMENAYFEAMTKAQVLDQRALSLREQLIEGNDDHNAPINAQLDELNLERTKIEEALGMCVVDQAQMQREAERVAAAEAQMAAQGPVITVEGAAYLLAATAGGLTLTNTDGQSFELARMTPDELKLATTSIQASLRDVQTPLPAALATALATAGIWTAQDQLAMRPPVDPAAEQKRLEEIATKAVAAQVDSGDSTMSASKYDALIAQGVPRAVLDKEMADNNIKKDTSLASELGLDALKPAMALGGAAYLFSSAQHFVQSIVAATPSFAPNGIFAAGYTPFADGPDFAKYNPPMMPGDLPPSYMIPAAFAGLTVAGLFGPAQSGPSPQEQAEQRARLELEQRLQLQRDLNSGVNGPRPPSQYG